jgi:hypothetical protein
MISVTSITKNYILQSGLIEKHRKTLHWLSSTVLWKRECEFFQKLLDRYASSFTALEDKKKLDHFQNLIVYYDGEVIDELRKKLRKHENDLAEMLQTKDELKIQYFKEHDTLMESLDSFRKSFTEYKKEFFEFVEKGMV